MRRKYKIIPKRRYNRRISFFKISVIALFFTFLYGFIFGVKLVLSDTGTYIPPTPSNTTSSLLKKVGYQQVDGENFQPTIKKDTVVFHGSRVEKKVALTFDADMTPLMRFFLNSGEVHSYYDEKLVDTLMKSNTKATFFMTGLWIESYPEQTKKLAESGLFELGNHSYSHPSFSGTCYGLQQIPEEKKVEEIQKTQALLNRYPGTHVLFRFPGGCYSHQDLGLVQKNGLTPLQWDVAGEDGFNNNAATIKDNILRRVTNGSIIVLHMNGYPNDPSTAIALPAVIEHLKGEGYEFVTVSELLHQQKQDTLTHIFDSLEHLSKI